MAPHLRRADSRDPVEVSSSPGRGWTTWLQHITSLVYLVGGVFLIYQYLTRLHRRVVLLTGSLFVIYAIYRFFLVRRLDRRARRAENRRTWKIQALHSPLRGGPGCLAAAGSLSQSRDPPKAN